MFDVDVLVIGGGPAGAASAVALAQLGLRVLIADAGVARERILAGELLHPAAVEDLRALGLTDAIEQARGQEVKGFVALDERPASRRASLLPYGENERGLALDHAALTDSLLEAAGKRDGVTLMRHTRVGEIYRNDASGVEVTLVGPAEVSSVETPVRVRARLLVGADGRASRVRKLLGISEHHVRLSSMVGVVVPADLLPYPFHGHLFVGGPAPVLAYAINPEHARVMVDLPLGSTPRLIADDASILSGVPEPLRQGIIAALAVQTPRVASNDTRLPDRVARGSAVLVGDAAGCCHPVSASGITSALRDARVLQDSVRQSQGSMERALSRYVHERRPAQRTRIALASALYQAFSGREGDMEALRSGLFRYWQETADGGRLSMSLLSSRESRMWKMAREYSRVVTHGVLALADQATQVGPRKLPRIAQAGAGLVASAWPWVQGAVAGMMEDMARRIPTPAAGPIARTRRLIRARISAERRLP